MKIQRIALTAGEPAGIGPDLCVQLAQLKQSCELVVIADPNLLSERAKQLKLDLVINHFEPKQAPRINAIGSITVAPVSLLADVCCGKLNADNSPYVIATIKQAVQGCMDGVFDALVTAPVNKAVVNDAGINFSGHTEYIAAITGGYPVMMLATPGLRVALVTTHIPLSEVSKAISAQRLRRVISTLHRGLRERFCLPNPVILVCGLNPHAGESGHLGNEEMAVITPVIESLSRQGMRLQGPLPADTLFTPPYLATADAVLAMYHDQGLPVLKHLGFGQAVNITLGLPIIRTSVDHGTALELAGSGKATSSSLAFAIKTAQQMLKPTPANTHANGS